jgi:ribonuclease PH
MQTPARAAHELRPVNIQRDFTRAAAGSVLYQAGNTTVLCTASVEETVPPWLEGRGRGWITAEYSMLPGSTSPRKRRDRGAKLDGRTTEIQRLIGRSFRAVADLAALGPRTITVDCDVLQADGGTRTAAITGGFVALLDALHRLRKDLPAGQGVSSPAGAARQPDSGESLSAPPPRPHPLRDSVAAVSVGIVDGRPTLDLDYQQDFAASVDMNVVMTGQGRFVEVQGTGEEATFSEEELQSLLRLARSGISQLIAIQRQVLGEPWPFGETP